MSDAPSRWPAWRPASEFPQAGVPVLVTTVFSYWGDGVPYIELAERPHNGPWMLWGGLVVLQPEEILGWMPCPPPMELSTGLSTKGASAAGKDEDDLT